MQLQCVVIHVVYKLKTEIGYWSTGQLCTHVRFVLLYLGQEDIELVGQGIIAITLTKAPDYSWCDLTVIITKGQSVFMDTLWLNWTLPEAIV